MDFVQIYRAILIPIAFLNTVITLAPVLTHNLKRTIESNTTDLCYIFICILSISEWTLSRFTGLF